MGQIIVKGKMQWVACIMLLRMAVMMCLLVVFQIFSYICNDVSFFFLIFAT